MGIRTAIADLSRDLGYTFRGFRAKPFFVIVSIVTLSLGIGVTAGIYTVLNAVLLRTLPVADPSQLMLPMVENDLVRDPIFSSPYLEKVKAALPPSSSLAIMTPQSSFSLQVGVEPGRAVGGQLVSGNYFSVLGTHAVLGRLIVPADDQTEGGSPVGVLSFDYWSTQFGRSPSVIGTTITVNRAPITIVGVAQEGFFGTRVGFTPAIWLPLHMQSVIRYSGNYANENGDESQPWFTQNGIRWLQAIVRVSDSTNLPQITSTFNTLLRDDIHSRLAGVDGATQQILLRERIALVPGSRGFQELQSKFSQPLHLLMSMAIVLLLIVCANIANLLLARAAVREREVALRFSIGASRGRVVRQMLTESLMLSYAGGIAGIAVAYACAHLLPRWAANGNSPLRLNLSPDWRVLGLGLVSCVITGVVFGLGPALQATRANPAMLMRGGSRSIVSCGSSRWSIGKLLVGAQVALSFCLLVAAGLFMRTMRNYSQLDLGFDRDHLLSVTIDTHAAGIPADQLPGLGRKVLDAMRAMPGVRSATLASSPIETGSRSISGINLSRGDAAAPQSLNVETSRITPGYFSTLGIPLLRGRDFSQSDAGDAGHMTPSVVIVNEAFVRLYLGNSDPLAARLNGNSGPPSQIIGIVADARTVDLREQQRPIFYTALYQTNSDFNDVLLRVSGSPHALEPALRSTLTGLGLPVSMVITVNEQIDQGLSQQNAVSRLTTFFGLLAVALASLGLYGVMTYNVSRRTNEIGVRLALGSQRVSLLWLILRESLIVVIAAIALGVCVALGTTQLASNLIFGLSAHDPATFIVSGLLLLVVGALASSIPAWRASRIDPMEALRVE
jgi:predicted permease